MSRRNRHQRRKIIGRRWKSIVNRRRQERCHRKNRLKNRSNNKGMVLVIIERKKKVKCGNSIVLVIIERKKESRVWRQHSIERKKIVNVTKY